MNGKPCKGQSCYPANGGFFDPDKLELGQKLKEPVRGGDGKFHTVQVIRCKYPECI